jgi:hypothetical protein
MIIKSNLNQGPPKYANFSYCPDFNENKCAPISMKIYIKGQSMMAMRSFGDL